MEETDDSLPKMSQIADLHRPNTTTINTRSLFSPPSLAKQTNDFELIPNTEIKDGILLRTQNPPLLAIRKTNNRITYKNIPEIHRPTTTQTFISASDTYQSSNLNSPSFSNANVIYNPNKFINYQTMLRKNPLTPLKSYVTKQSGTQIVEKEIEDERNSISFQDDPITYFSKHKDGRGHRFIYLTYEIDKSDPFFSPYKLKKVPFAEVSDDYFTMSINGVTHIFPGGSAECTSLDNWTKEVNQYNAIRKLMIFGRYLFWKPFRIWKKFLMRKRYKRIKNEIISFPMFNNSIFFHTSSEAFQSSVKQILSNHLLCLIPQKRFKMKDYKELCDVNIDKLEDDFFKLFQNYLGIVLELDADIRDPSRTVIKNSDFPESHKYFPKLGELLILQEKKSSERQRRLKIVGAEMESFAHFIRLMDYSILEDLIQNALICWKQAYEVITQEMSSIFTIEVGFSENGDIVFIPSCHELISVLNESLDRSLTVLDHLPRLLLSPEIRPHLREIYIDLEDLFDQGPTFKLFSDSLFEFTKTKDNILNYVAKSFAEAEEHSQAYKEYFPIYNLGKQWDPNIYLYPRGGPSHIFYLNKTFNNKIYDVEEEDQIEYDPSKLTIVNFEAVRKDVKRFNEDKAKLAKFRICIICGPLYVDSRQLRSILTPIPVNSLLHIQNELNDLVQNRIDFIIHIFKICGMRLKQEPTKLEVFVDFCNFINIMKELTPFLITEVQFLYDLFALFDACTFSLSDDIEHIRTHLNIFLENFKKDQIIAEQTKEFLYDKFVEKLDDIINYKEKKLQKYYDIIISFPSSLSDGEIDIILKITQRTKQKFEDITPDIEELISSQEILQHKKTDFSLFYKLKHAIKYKEHLFECIDKWKSAKYYLNDISFSQVDIKKFGNIIISLNEMVLKMKNDELLKFENIHVLIELYEKVVEIVPYLEELEILSNSKMQIHHWNQLFEGRGQGKSYYPQIKMQELISLGILQDKDLILAITSSSQGEAQIEAEFKEISDKLNSLQLPILNSADVKKDKNIIIGSIDDILSEIFDAQIILRKMLHIPYVYRIKQNIINLSNKLENVSNILEEWYIFQRNWMILNPIFTEKKLESKSTSTSYEVQEPIKKILPQTANKFKAVKHRWLSFVNNIAYDNSNLFHICSFPSLLEILKENNRSNELILETLYQYIDKKREYIPRFYFLSNDEVLTLISTNDFSTFNNEIVKVFMQIKSLDYKHIESKERSTFADVQNFSSIKVFGLIGKRNHKNNLLPFEKPVQCLGAIEQWLNQIIDEMKVSFKENLLTSLKKFSQVSILQWMSDFNLNIIIIALNIIFTNEFQECFNNFENDIHSFSNYKNVINERIKTLTESLNHQNEEKNDIEKCSLILMIINHYLNLLTKLMDHSPDLSQSYNWKYSLKFQYDQQKNSLFLNYGKYTTEHGGEFYGNPRIFIFCKSSLKTMDNMLSVLGATDGFNHILLTGGENIGKTDLSKILALFFGRPSFVCSSFSDCSSTILLKMFLGTIGSGGFLILKNTDNLSYDNMSFIYNFIKKIQYHQMNKDDYCTINEKTVNLNEHFRFIMTMKTQKSNNYFPEQLKSVLKPIGYSAPNMFDIIKNTLFSFGFQNANQIAIDLINCIKTIENIFTYLQIKSIFTPVFHIIRNAYKLFIELINQREKSFLDIDNEIFSTEQFVIARALYSYFIHQIRISHISMFCNILFTNFRVFNNIDIFKMRISKPELFQSESFERKLNKIVKNEIEKNSNYQSLSIPYYQEKVIALSHMLQNYQCIVLTGDPNSGKSLLLDLLQKTYDVIHQENEHILPIKIYEIYHQSDSSVNIFGKINDFSFNASQKGQFYQHYGQIHSILYQISQNRGKFNQILKFDGPLSTSFTNFLNESINGDLFRSNSFDNFFLDDNLHFIVETDDVSNLSPLFMSYSAVLPMRNLQISRNFSSESSTCEVTNPQLIFSRFLPFLKSNFSTEETEKLKIIFCQMAPAIVTFVFRLKNNIYSSESPIKMKSGAVIISDHMPYLALKYASYYIKESYCNVYDEKQLRIYFAFAFFSVFSNILEPMSIVTFDTWIRASYQISVPLDWVGYNVGDHFWNVFPRPCLQAMYPSNNKMAPINYKLLNESVYITPNERTFNKDDPTILLQDVNVLTAHFIPTLNLAKTLIKNKENIIIYGPKFSGKSNFLNILLKHSDDNIMPIYLSSYTPYSNSTTESLLGFLEMHTQTTVKHSLTSKSDTTYALIFDQSNIHDIQTFELIRMIATTNTLPLYSNKDPKLLQYVHLHNFFIIVIIEDIRFLSSRFISKFTPIKINEPPVNTIKYILLQILTYFHVENTFINPLMKFLFSINFEHNMLFKIINLLIQMPNKLKDKANNDLYAKTMLFDFDILYYHIANNEQKSNFDKLFLQCFSENNYKQCYEDFINSTNIAIPIIKYNPDKYTLDINFNIQQQKQILEELKFYTSSLKQSDKYFYDSIKFYPYFLKKYLMIQRIICFPRGTIFLKGKTGYGRKTLARLIAGINEYRYYELLLHHNLDIKSLFKEIFIKTIENSNPVIVFIEVDNTESTNPEEASNLKTLNIIGNIIQNYELSLIFNKNELINLYQRTMKFSSKDPHENLNIYNKIKDIIQMKMRFIISVDYSFDTRQFSESAYTVYFGTKIQQNDRVETADNHSLHNQFMFCTIKELEDISKYLLSQNSFLAKYPSLNKLFAELHNNIATRFVRIHPNQYIDFLNTFCNFFNNEVSYYSTRQENNKNALDYILFIESQSSKLKEEISTLEQVVHELQNQTLNESNNYQNKKESIDFQIKQLENYAKELNEKIKAQTIYLNEMKNEIDQDKINLEKSKHNITKINDNDINLLQTYADNSPTILRNLISFICVLLGLSDDYDISGHDFLLNKSFYTIVKHLDSSNISTRSIKNATEFLERNNINSEELIKFNNEAFLLYSWLFDLYRFAFHSNEIKTTEELLESNKVTLENHMKDMQNQRETLHKMQKELDKKYKGLHKLSTNFTEKKEHLDILQNKYKITTSILENINILKSNIRQYINNYQLTQRTTIGNAILYSSFIVYCGALEQDEKLTFLNEIAKQLKDSNISFSEEGDNILIMICSKLSLHDDINKSLSFDKYLSQETQRDFRHIFQCLRTPLLMDNDGFVIEYIKKGIKPNRFAYTSLMSSDFENVLLDSIENGKILLLNDVNYLHPIIERIIPINNVQTTYGSNSDLKLHINKKFCTVHPKFKLILLTSERSSRYLPNSLLARVTFIKTSMNFSLELIIKTILYKKLFTEYTYVPTSTDSIELKIESQKSENELIDTMSELYINLQDSSNDIDLDEIDFEFTDDEVIEDFLNLKGRYASMIKPIKDANSNGNKEDESIIQLIQTIKNLWYVISQYIPKVGIKHNYLLNNLISSISDSIDITIDFIKSQDDVNSLILNGKVLLFQKFFFEIFFKTLCESLHFHEIAFTLFIFSFFLRVQEGRSKMEDLNVIITHIITEMNENVEQNNNDEIPGDPFEQIKFSSIQNIFPYIQKCIKETINLDVDQYIPTFCPDYFVSEDPQKVILIRSFINSDYSESLESFVQLRRKRTKFRSFLIDNFIHNDKNNIESIKDAMNLAMKKGEWVALFYCKPSVKSAELIHQIHENLLENPPENKNFRLIIVAETIKYLSSNILSLKCYGFSSFPAVRTQVEQIHFHFNSLITKISDINKQNVQSNISIESFGKHLFKPKFNKEAFQKIVYMCSLALSSINYRHLVSPAGFLSKFYISPTLMHDIIESIKNILEMQTKEIPFRNIIDVIIQNYLGRLVYDDFDEKKIQNLIHFMVCPEIMIPNFNFTTSECWKIPENLSKLKHLPSFAKADFLLMEEKFGNKLLNWNISKISSLLFHQLRFNDNFVYSYNIPYESIIITLPEIIPTTDESKFNSPLLLFLLSEIEKYNYAILEMKRSLINQDNDVCNPIMKDKVPLRWQNICGYNGISALAKFINYMADKHDFLNNWLENQKTPNPIDTKYITNFKGLFSSFIHEQALKLNESPSSLSYFFSTEEKDVASDDFICFYNLYLMCGTFNHLTNSLVDDMSKSPTVVKMPPLYCKLKNKNRQRFYPSKLSTNTKCLSSTFDKAYGISIPLPDDIYYCPMFKSLPSEEFILDYDYNRTDGIIENFIMYVPLHTTEPVWRHIANGTSLICHISDVFL